MFLPFFLYMLYFISKAFVIIDRTNIVPGINRLNIVFYQPLFFSNTRFDSERTDKIFDTSPIGTSIKFFIGKSVYMKLELINMAPFIIFHTSNGIFRTLFFFFYKLNSSLSAFKPR